MEGDLWGREEENRRGRKGGGVGQAKSNGRE